MRPAFAEIETLTRLWDHTYRSIQPTDTFITYSERSEELTYKQISALAHCLAAYFVWAGLKRGDRVALLCENTPMYMAMDLAMNLSNAVNVSIPPGTPPKLIRQIITDFQIKVLYLSSYDLYCKHKSWLDGLANRVITLCDVPPLLELSETDKLVALYCATDVGKNYWREHLTQMRNLKYQLKGDDKATIFIEQKSDEEYRSVQFSHSEMISLLGKLSEDYKQALSKDQKLILSVEPFYTLFGRLAGLYLPLMMNDRVFLNRTNRTLLQDIQRCAPNLLVAELKSIQVLFDALKRDFTENHSFRARYFDSSFANAIKVQELKHKKQSVSFGLNSKYNFAKRTVLHKAKKELLQTVDFILTQPNPDLYLTQQRFQALETVVIPGTDLTSVENVYRVKKKDEYIAS
jgi:long-subunit acyl-CoA synthetase (AMP-forming)